MSRPVLKGEVKQAFALLLNTRFSSSLSWPNDKCAFSFDRWFPSQTLECPFPVRNLHQQNILYFSETGKREIRALWSLLGIFQTWWDFWKKYYKSSFWPLYVITAKKRLKIESPIVLTSNNFLEIPNSGAKKRSSSYKDLYCNVKKENMKIMNRLCFVHFFCFSFVCTVMF